LTAFKREVKEETGLADLCESDINKENANPMAQSPAVAKAYVGFNQALSQGSLSAKIRERIALAVAEEIPAITALRRTRFSAKKQA
jgi:hypothetical protein